MKQKPFKREGFTPSNNARIMQLQSGSFRVMSVQNCNIFNMLYLYIYGKVMIEVGIIRIIFFCNDPINYF